MIKGKRKNLSPEDNLDSIRAANDGLIAWRIKKRRPRRRVTIAYSLSPDLWAEFECRRRIASDGRGHWRHVSVVTYRRQAERPIGGFIANGKAYPIQRPSGEYTRVSYAFTPGKSIGIPGDIVVVFQKVWGLNIDKGLIEKAWNDWNAKNEQQPGGKVGVLAVKE